MLCLYQQYCTIFEYSTWMYLLSNFLSPGWQISIDHYLRTRAKNKKESKYSLYIMMSRHTVPSGKNWIVIIPPQLAQGSVSVIHPPPPFLATPEISCIPPVACMYSLAKSYTVGLEAQPINPSSSTRDWEVIIIPIPTISQRVDVND